MTYVSKSSRRLALWRSSSLSLLLALLTACTTDPQENSDARKEDDSGAGIGLVVTPKHVAAEIGQGIQLIAHGSQYSSAGRFQQLAERIMNVEWTASGGTITDNGQFLALKAGTYKVVAKGRGRTKPDTSTVVVIPAPAGLIGLVVTPDTAKLSTDGTRAFVAKGILSDSTLTDVGVTWTADGGTIDAGGLYVAGPAGGIFHAVATSVSSSLGDTAVIVVEASSVPPPPTLVALHLTPDSVALLSGQTQQFAPQARMSDGSTRPIPATYTASGGSIDASGLFTAGPAAGTFRVIATSDSGLADTSRVVISAPQLGTTIYPGQSIQAAVNAFPGNTTFLLKAGVHRLQQVTPKDGDKFAGERGAVLDGAALLTAFVQEGGYWTISGQTAQGEIRLQGACQGWAPGCAYPEQLFLDDAPLQHVDSRSAVGSGKWFFDYALDKIYLVDDPRGKKVELSVLPYAFYSTASNVTIEGLIVEKYASPAQRGAIGFSGPGRSWTVQNNEVRWNHGAGIRPGDGMQILSNNVHHQGQIGIAGSGSGVVVADNEIAYNNTAGFGPGQQGEAGGTKFTFTRGLVVRGNYSHHNHGPGLWTDINNIDCLYDGNRVEDNDWRGIFHEVSYKCLIRNNVVRRNGFAFPGTAGAVDGAGILVSSSRDTEIYGNLVEDNRNGIAGQETDRPTPTPPAGYGSHDLVNLWVHDNTIRQTDTGHAAGVADYDPYVDPYVPSANNRWASNIYTVGSGTRYRWANNSDVSLSQWRGMGQDSGSTFR
jgi:parallel beta-helix repeat protein